MSEFDEYWGDRLHSYDYPKPAARDAWNFQQAKIDELQARVDEALRHVVDHGGYDDLTHVIDILKGNKDEN